jgi:putative membrane-bound dehydrogenase-like protein
VLLERCDLRRTGVSHRFRAIVTTTSTVQRLLSQVIASMVGHTSIGPSQPRILLGGRAGSTGIALLLVLWLGWFHGDAASVIAGDEGASAEAASKPRSPDESAAMTALDPSVRMELAAAEPEVIDPVAICFDHRGRMFVVEMRDYPTGPVDGGGPQARIRVLRDLDHDGRYETSNDFVEGLVFPTGVLPWRDGVITTVSGAVLFLRDTDGDDRCDVQERWFEGFSETNEQLRASHPSIGPDGLVYIASGLRGGMIRPTDPRWPAKQDPIQLDGHTFVFDPCGGWYGRASGESQYGLHIDDFGRRLVCDNRRPADEVIFSADVIERDPYLLPADADVGVIASGEQSKVYPVVRTWTTSNLHEGQFTAACGVHRYGGTALPESMRGSVFVCEPTGYLVQRQSLHPAGVVPHGHHDSQGSEFLASGDRWLRPVDLASGPDGALYLVDMYRAVIEHPEWVPDELKHRPDERWGNDRGRVWRLVDKAWQRADPKEWDPTSLSQLVQRLSDPDVWVRQTATRLLVEADRTMAIASLRDAKCTTAEGEARKIQLLTAFHAIDGQSLLQSIQSEDPNLRALAARLSTGRMDAIKSLQVASQDPDHRVVFESVLALSTIEDPAAAMTIAQVGVRRATDPLMLQAIASGPPQVAADVLKHWLTDQPLQLEPIARHAAFKQVARRATSEGTIDAIDRLVDLPWTTVPMADRMVVLGGLHEGWQRSNRPAAELRTRLTGMAIGNGYADAQTISAEKSAEISLRLAAIELLGDAEPELAIAALRPLLASDDSDAVLQASIASLARAGDEGLENELLQRMATQSIVVRRSAIDHLMQSASGAMGLLSRIESGELPRATLELSQAEQLRRHPSDDVRQRCEQVFAVVAGNRTEVLKKYQSSITDQGDLQRGRAVFKQHCASCHRVGDEGLVVGPDISDSRTQSRDQLLLAVLDPNAAIDAAYFRYTAITTDGRSIDGLLVDRTALSITLKRSGGELTTVHQSELELLQPAGVSLMPEGFEQQIDIQQMTDLLRFLKDWRYVDGIIPVAK